MFLQLGIFVRYTRSAIIEVMGKDYIKTAKAKGLKPKTVIVMHALRNALIPIVTICSLSFGTVFSGAIITETIFAYQGVGKLLFDSMMGNDYNVAMISLIISTAMVLTMSFVADVLYAVVDPRISYK
jgi:peptide/nickel transport system permease protein